jgi:hypothetical protein
MDQVTEPVRWAGLLVAFGVMLPMLLWVVVQKAGRVTRGVVSVMSAVFLLYAAGSAIGRTSIVGLLISYREFGPSSDLDFDVAHLTLLLLGGGLAGLLVAGLLRGRADAGEPVTAAEDEVEAPVEETPPIAGRTEVLGDEPATEHWATRLVDREPRQPAPEREGGGSVTALLLAALGLAVPLSGFGFPFSARFSLARLVEPDAWDVAALVAEGLLAGFALLLAALELRPRHVPVIGLAFLLVATGQGAVSAFPETFDKQTWYLVGTGLAAGLLLPAALRLLRRVVTRDALVTAAGVLLAVATIVASSALDSQARREREDRDSDGTAIVSTVGD